jgi:hypothetical protein
MTSSLASFRQSLDLIGAVENVSGAQPHGPELAEPLKVLEHVD